MIWKSLVISRLGRRELRAEGGNSHQNLLLQRAQTQPWTTAKGKKNQPETPLEDLILRHYYSGGSSSHATVPKLGKRIAAMGQVPCIFSCESHWISKTVTGKLLHTQDVNKDNLVPLLKEFKSSLVVSKQECLSAPPNLFLSKNTSALSIWSRRNSDAKSPLQWQQVLRNRKRGRKTPGKHWGFAWTFSDLIKWSYKEKETHKLC